MFIYCTNFLFMFFFVFVKVYSSFSVSFISIYLIRLFQIGIIYSYDLDMTFLQFYTEKKININFW